MLFKSSSSFLLVLVFALAACTPSPTPFLTPFFTPASPAVLTATPVSPGTPVATEIRTWLQQNAMPLTSTQPGTGTSDLQPLKRILGDARIVALGEGTHGTHEFFQMKHRLVEFLVQEMGFTIFAMEANSLEADQLNAYLQTGQGDPAALLAGLGFWTWNTQEVLDLVRWMRSYNATRGDAPPLVFAGVDMQAPAKPMDQVVQFLNRADPPSGTRVSALFDCVRLSQVGQSFASLDEKVRAQCKENLQTVYTLLNEHRTQYIAATSTSDFEQALHSARLVQQFADVFSTAHEDSAARDRYLAENVTWLLDRAGARAKVILWAHNAHVRVATQSVDTMGAHLRQKYGDGMKNIGLLFYSGSFNAVAITASGQSGALATHQAALPLPDSYEYYLHGAGLSRYILDLHSVARSSATTDWLFEPKSLRSIGALYDDSHPESFLQRAVLTDLFDLLLYLEDTSPSQLLTSPSWVQVSPPTYPAQPENLDLEQGTAGWAIYANSASDYDIGTDRAVAHSGDAGGYIHSRVDKPKGFIVLGQMVTANRYRGQRLRLSAYLKTEISNGGAGILMRVDGVDKILGISNMQSHPISGTTAWKRYEVVLDVPVESGDIMLGVWLDGTGQVAFDDFQLETAGP